MIKVIIFDADGVLNHGRRPSIALEEDYGISLEKTLPFFNGPFKDCRLGRADLKEVIVPYLADWGWDKGVDAFLDYWFKVHNDIDLNVVEYIKELRKRGVVCLLGTNQEKYRFEYMLSEMGFRNVFDKTYVSAYLGHKKPELEFFLKIFNELGNIQKDEILFVDDDVKNIRAAKDFGINAEFYTTFEDFKEKMKQYIG